MSRSILFVAAAAGCVVLACWAAPGTESATPAAPEGPGTVTPAPFVAPLVQVGPELFELRERTHAIRFDRQGVRWSSAGQPAAAWSFETAEGPRSAGALPAQVLDRRSGGTPRTLSAHRRIRYPQEGGAELWIEPITGGFTWGATVPAGSGERGLRFRYAGVDQLATEGDRVLAAHATGGALRETGLRCYQVLEGTERDVPCGYADLRREQDGAWTYAVRLGPSDPRHPVVIDPTVRWTATLSSAGFDEVLALATLCDTLYVGGAVAGPLLDVPDGGLLDGGFDGVTDGFLARYRTDGGLRWLTYLGGTAEDAVKALELGPAGEVYVGGTTRSDLALTRPRTDGTNTTDLFLAELGPDGALRWDVRLEALNAGNLDVRQLVADGEGGLFFVGAAENGWLAGAQEAFTGTVDGIAGRLDSNQQLRWTTHLVNVDGVKRGLALAWAPDAGLYAGGTAAVTGTWSGWSHAPATGGTDDAFVVRLDPETGKRLWLGRMGGNENDRLGGMLIRDGKLYVSGSSSSGSTFGTPALKALEGFVARLQPAGGLDGNPRFFGGSSDELMFGLTQGASALHLAGLTNSPGFAGVALRAGRELFGAKLDPSLTTDPTYWALPQASADSNAPIALGQGWLFVGGLVTDAGGANGYLAALDETDPPRDPRGAAFCSAYEGYAPPADGGLDAGATVDAGGTQDAGAEVDAGLTADAGTGAADGGSEPAERSAYGWSCSSVATAPAVCALAALLLLGRRRRG